MSPDSYCHLESSFDSAASLAADDLRLLAFFFSCLFDNQSARCITQSKALSFQVMVLALFTHASAFSRSSNSTKHDPLNCLVSGSLRRRTYNTRPTLEKNS